MLNKKKLQEILQQSVQKKWTYPAIFDALKAAGVEFYETEVPRHQVVYHGGGEQWGETPPPLDKPYHVGPCFDRNAIQLALRRVQNRQTDYTQFLKEIAAAGVVKYRVDMPKRTVTYLGKEGESQVELVPPSA